MTFPNELCEDYDECDFCERCGTMLLYSNENKWFYCPKCHPDYEKKFTPRNQSQSEQSEKEVAKPFSKIDRGSNNQQTFKDELNCSGIRLRGGEIKESSAITNGETSSSPATSKHYPADRKPSESGSRIKDGNSNLSSDEEIIEKVLKEMNINKFAFNKSGSQERVFTFNDVEKAISLTLELGRKEIIASLQEKIEEKRSKVIKRFPYHYKDYRDFTWNNPIDGLDFVLKEISEIFKEMGQ
jgi:DNA-directed RNA polymerase subunit M/transcription elongation factor TFIIS